MSTGKWRHPPGAGSSVDQHPTSLMIRHLVRLGMRPAEIHRALAWRWWRELRLGLLPPLPSLSTLKRFVRFHLPEEEAQSAFQRVARRRYREATDGGGGAAVAKETRVSELTPEEVERLRVAAIAEAARRTPKQVSHAAERRAVNLAAIERLRQMEAARRQQWQALGAAERRT